MSPRRFLSWMWLTSSSDWQLQTWFRSEAIGVVLMRCLSVLIDTDQRVTVFQLDTSQKCLCYILMCLCNGKHKWEYSLGVFKFHNPNLTSLCCLHLESGLKALGCGWSEGEAILLTLDTALVVVSKLAISRLSTIPHQNKNDIDIVW